MYWKKQWWEFSRFARVLHIYFSTLLLTLLILFCATGIVLNHLDWLSGSSTDGSVEAKLPAELKQKLSLLEQSDNANPPYNEIQVWLREHYQLRHPESIDYDAEFSELLFDYQIPGGYASAIVNLDGELNLEYRQGSAWSILGDLHKGRHSGAVWAWVIDLSAVLMILFAITGMIILFQNRRHRYRALALALVGTVSPIFIYVLWVPRLAGIN